MKKVFVYITLVVSCVALILSVAIVISAVEEVKYLNSQPGTSGVDYLSVIMLRNFLVMTSIAGFISSFVCLCLSNRKALKVTATILLAIQFVVILSNMMIV